MKGYMDKQSTKDKQSNKGKNFIGTVLSIHTAKTAKVEVGYIRKHPMYKKALNRTRRFACHNELTDMRVGDTVEICQIRPMSRTKHFSIVRKM
ncbi:MAG: 30S ribosomal protein S17 [Candidatus Gottesmanbacteria bacterium GW2011_GWA2_44_17]|uniref:30S ribosomal protein S17 n=3 Tax=Candidatus Gottesmaniibacteriota TaxID=1752720 RepID=A0A0G1IPU6_9BACT|nr:MAG: 30S ribosomal protein S17 [Microgenomates group bacterium GW2011_GWC1_43_11]KKT38660.1 MAG: 30S ribosomal protein S17 [Candidatus Gottesmanbacteria bacterium GW2011_GWB1_44_11c]KKT47354.1 MAG: 30S ribosomal protein S17 [Candidatus Gottesmanbacteria bacterium GW2011_GWA2_44_17]KKT61155.1 MAG: 30S ribosomal protein S17 [Candidatus Gottesmanbacteria bacterium GW2011_GWA1_44_24b]HCM82415.1 30S ribosomal protein S17 [Patescibacteria group bacterium]